MFKVMRSGKRQNKQWKRMLTKVTFVGGAFTRKPPKYERFVRPTGAALVHFLEMPRVSCNIHTPLLSHSSADAVELRG